MSIEKEDWQSFQDRLSVFNESIRRFIDRAYQLSKKAHKMQLRDDETRFFEHPRCVALILWDECGIRDPNMIIAALLHDSAEDSAIWGNSRKYKYAKWIEIVRENITAYFNQEVADMVVALTKPHGTDIVDKNKVREIYLKNMQDASAKTILIKMADRLHNFRTLPSTTREKQDKYLKETPEDYFPIFQLEKVKREFPEESTYLMEQMKTAIAKVENLR